MPALQVRDFPEDMYEKLRICAQRNHRSMAQQTIVAVEQMLQRENQDNISGDEQVVPVRHYAKHQTLDTEEQRLARIKKRKEVFAKIKESKPDISPDFPSPEEMVRQSREERSIELEKNMPRCQK